MPLPNEMDTDQDIAYSVNSMPPQVDFQPKMNPNMSSEELERLLNNYTQLKTPSRNIEDVTPITRPSTSVTETLPPPPSQIEVLQDLLQKREQSNLNNILLRAGMMGNEAIAQGRGARVPVNEGALKALEEQAQQPLESFATRVKSKDVLEMQDPNSDISKFTRERAKEMMARINPNFDIKQFDKMSASQLESLGFKFAGTQMRQPEVRFERVQDEFGNVRLKAFDKITGEEVRDLGTAGFASQFRTDPNTGELIGLNPANLSTGPRQISGTPRQVVSEERDEAKGPKSAFEINKMLNPKTKQVVNDVKKEFIKETEEARKVIAGLDGTKKMLDLAEKNPAGKPIAAAAVTRLFEKGVLTDKDVERYVIRQGIFNSAEDYAAQLSSGTFSKEQVIQLAQALDAYKRQQQEQVDKIARQKAENVAGYIDPNLNLSSKDLSNMIYTKPKSEQKVKIQLPDGRVGSIPEAKLQEALKRGAKVVEE